jgi:hypothetical protein
LELSQAVKNIFWISTGTRSCCSLRETNLAPLPWANTRASSKENWARGRHRLPRTQTRAIVLDNAEFWDGFLRESKKNNQIGGLSDNSSKQRAAV